MGKTELCKLYGDELIASSTPCLANLGKARYLSVEGMGEPGGEAFPAATGFLFTVAYSAKMGFRGRQDYPVGKLEGLWWAGKQPFMEQPRSDWRWRLLIRTPDFITERDVSETIGRLIAKGKPEGVRRVTLHLMDEGTAVQVLHTGPFSGEAKQIEAMHALAAREGYELTGHHHEIYLTDFRRAAPEKLRTILRHPVRRPQ